MKISQLSENFSHVPSSAGSMVFSNKSIITGEDDHDHDQKRRQRTGYYYFLCGCIIGTLLLGIVLAVILTLKFMPLHRTTTTVDSATTHLATVISTITTTSTTGTSTVTTTVTTTMTTSTSTSTTLLNICYGLRWNQTGEPVAGTHTAQYSSPTCLHIDQNDTIYVCDHSSRGIEAWFKNASVGIQVVHVGSVHSDFAATDRYGFLYFSEHMGDAVQRCDNSLNSCVTVAGDTSSSIGFNALSRPLGIDVDSDLNIYVADSSNNRVMKWAHNTTNGTLLIDVALAFPTAFISGLALAHNSSDQVFLSDQNSGSVYLWKFGASFPSAILNQVFNNQSLRIPRDLVLDQYGNLYVAEKTSGGRVIRYCNSSTTGDIVLTGDATSSSAKIGIAFDSNLNLYALLQSGTVMKYHRI